MRRAIVTFLAYMPALAFGAMQGPEGRWQGHIRIPGRELPVVVDLAIGDGAWSGSIILPGLGVKGAPLAKIVATPTDIAFDVVMILDTPAFGPAHFDGHLNATGAIDGEMRQGGNIARFSLARTGPPQVDAPVTSTPVSRTLEDQWIGEFDLGGYPRRVTITLENHADGPATATLVVVGKQTTRLPVDRVIEDGSFITIESTANQVAFEGRFVKQNDAIEGTFGLGPLERPLVLRRSARRPS